MWRKGEMGHRGNRAHTRGKAREGQTAQNKPGHINGYTEKGLLIMTRVASGIGNIDIFSHLNKNKPTGAPSHTPQAILSMLLPLSFLPIIISFSSSPSSFL